MRGFYILWLVAACATLEPLDTKIEPQHRRSFQKCSDKKGSGTFAVDLQNLKEERRIFSGEMDWANDKEFALEVVDPLGGTFLSLKKDRDLLIMGGHRGLPVITNDPQGFLVIDEHTTGIRFEELACFLQFSLPASWLDLKTLRANESTQYFFKDDKRLIEVKFHQDEFFPKICIAISWKTWWVFGNVSTQGCLSPLSHDIFWSVEDHYRMILKKKDS